MTIEDFLKVIKALGIDPSTSLEDAMAKIRGEAPDDDDDDDGPPSSANGGPPDSSANPAKPPEASGAAPAAAPADGASDDDKKDKKPEAVAAAASKLMRLTGAKSFVAAIDIVETFKTSHLELETERQKLAAERETLEAAERRRGCVELVTLAGHAPATVWSDDKATTPKKYLAAMPIADFREYVTDAVAAKGGKKAASAVKPPITGQVDHGLTPEELSICASMKCDPKDFKALKAQRDGVKTLGGN